MLDGYIQSARLTRSLCTRELSLLTQLPFDGITEQENAVLSTTSHRIMRRLVTECPDAFVSPAADMSMTEMQLFCRQHLIESENGAFRSNALVQTLHQLRLRHTRLEHLNGLDAAADPDYLSVPGAQRSIRCNTIRQLLATFPLNLTDCEAQWKSLPNKPAATIISAFDAFKQLFLLQASHVPVHDVVAITCHWATSSTTMTPCAGRAALAADLIQAASTASATNENHDALVDFIESNAGLSLSNLLALNNAAPPLTDVSVELRAHLFRELMRHGLFDFERFTLRLILSGYNNGSANAGLHAIYTSCLETFAVGAEYEASRCTYLYVEESRVKQAEQQHALKQAKHATAVSFNAGALTSSDSIHIDFDETAAEIVPLDEVLAGLDVVDLAYLQQWLGDMVRAIISERPSSQLSATQLDVVRNFLFHVVTMIQVFIFSLVLSSAEVIAAMHSLKSQRQHSLVHYKQTMLLLWSNVSTSSSAISSHFCGMGQPPSHCVKEFALRSRQI